MWKVLSQGICMCNMKALSLVVRKLWPRLNFLFTHTRRRGRGHQGYDISSPDIRPGSLKIVIVNIIHVILCQIHQASILDISGWKATLFIQVAVAGNLSTSRIFCPYKNQVSSKSIKQLWRSAKKVKSSWTIINGTLQSSFFVITQPATMGKPPQATGCGFKNYTIHQVYIKKVCLGKVHCDFRYFYPPPPLWRRKGILPCTLVSRLVWWQVSQKLLQPIYWKTLNPMGFKLSTCTLINIYMKMIPIALQIISTM